MVEVVVVMGTVAAEGNSERKGLAQPSGSPYTLLVIEALRGHICHHYRLQRADIDSDLHCRRDTQHVNAIRELIFLGGRKQRSLELSLALPLFREWLCL